VMFALYALLILLSYCCVYPIFIPLFEQMNDDDNDDNDYDDDDDACTLSRLTTAMVTSS